MSRRRLAVGFGVLLLLMSSVFVGCGNPMAVTATSTRIGQAPIPPLPVGNASKPAPAASLPSGAHGAGPVLGN